MKRHTAIIIMILILFLTSCQSKQDAPDTSQAAVKTTTTSAAADTSEGDIGDDTPLEWPVELMDDVLPVPSGTITSIDRASDIWGESAPEYITVVSFKSMSREDCLLYVEKLKKLEFTDDATDLLTNSKITYSGSITDVGIAVTFEYDFAVDTGFVSYNPQLDSGFLDKWPQDKMGNLPDPGCILIDCYAEGEGENTVCSVDFANMKEAAAKEYIEKLKGIGYDPDQELADDVNFLFKGFDKEGRGVVFYYSIIYENGIISFGKKQSFEGC